MTEYREVFLLSAFTFRIKILMYFCEMSSIRITLNGEHKQTVSLEGNDGVLTCILNYMGRQTESGRKEDEFHMSCGGIDNVTGDRVNWGELEIAEGDRIEIDILKASESEPPA